MTICAVIGGADTWVEIENYSIAKQEWLATFLDLPNGIPSHDTFERMFARLCPEPVQQCFLSWVQAVFNISDGQLISLDGRFREDQSRVTQGYCAENLAVIRHLAVNLLTQEKSAKGGTRAKRLNAGWDNHSLTKILAQVPIPSRKL